jgi:hypothetical protein
MAYHVKVLKVSGANVAASLKICNSTMLLLFLLEKFQE